MWEAAEGGILGTSTVVVVVIVALVWYVTRGINTRAPNVYIHEKRVLVKSYVSVMCLMLKL